MTEQQKKILLNICNVYCFLYLIWLFYKNYFVITLHYLRLNITVKTIKTDI